MDFQLTIKIVFKNKNSDSKNLNNFKLLAQ